MSGTQFDLIIHKKSKFMLLTKFHELDRSINDHLNRLESAFLWPSVSTSNKNRSNWTSDSTDDSYIVKVSVPGHDKDTVSAMIEKDHLLIQADVETESALISNYRFKFSLPKDCDRNSDSIDAKIENGILTVTLPKQIEVKKTASIKIK